MAKCRNLLVIPKRGTVSDIPNTKHWNVASGMHEPESMPPLPRSAMEGIRLRLKRVHSNVEVVM